MLEKVYSGLPFFYNWDENKPGIISCHVKLKEAIDCRILEAAVNEALEIHKHFKVRLVIDNNNVYYEYYTVVPILPLLCSLPHNLNITIN